MVGEDCDTWSEERSGSSEVCQNNFNVWEKSSVPCYDKVCGCFECLVRCLSLLVIMRSQIVRLCDLLTSVIGTPRKSCG